MPVLVDHERTRRQIALLAVGIIAKDGIAGLTTRHIAEVAGTSRGLVSTYFRDMRELTLAAFRLTLEGQVALLEEAESAGADLRGCVEALLPIDDERLRYWRVIIAFYGAALADAELATYQRERIDGAVQRFERILMREHGASRPTAAIRSEAQRIVSAIIGEAVHHVFHPSEHVNAREARRMVSRVLDPQM